MTAQTLTKYGFAGVMLFALLYFMQMVLTDMKTEIRKLGDDVDMVSRTVDLSCQPRK